MGAATAELPPDDDCPSDLATGIKRLSRLREISEELGGLLNRCQKYARCERGPLALQGSPGLDAICYQAARLQSAAPVQFPVTEEGRPIAYLPPGFGLPCPTVPQEIASASVLRAATKRPPPPDMEVLDHSPGVWEVRIRPIPPAEVAFFTMDGSLPEPGKPNTRQATARGIALRMGGKIFAAAFQTGLHRSDIVAVTASRGPRRPQVQSAVGAETSAEAPRDPSTGNAGLGSGASPVPHHSSSPIPATSPNSPPAALPGTGVQQASVASGGHLPQSSGSPIPSSGSPPAEVQMPRVSPPTAGSPPQSGHNPPASGSPPASRASQGGHTAQAKPKAKQAAFKSNLLLDDDDDSDDD